jgi:REP element-mobilizing transposase RayT
MTDPRWLIEGTTYMVTRRCTQRQFLLKPSKFLNHALLFLIARAAERAGVHLHAACVLSNHLHILVTDPGKNLSKFMAWLDSMVARVLNAYYGRWENFFARPESFNDVKLLDADAVLRKLVYVLTNPVEAGLVSAGARWPGVRLSPRRVGHPEEIERPNFFFRKNGPVPERVTLNIVKPPVFQDLSDEEYKQLVQTAVLEKEAEIRKRFEASKSKFHGEEKVRAQSHKKRPANCAPRMQREPHVACRDRWRRKRALQERKQFIEDYREALEEFCRRMKKHSADALKVVFPRGTYWMCERYGVRCLGSPAPS